MVGLINKIGTVLTTCYTLLTVIIIIVIKWRQNHFTLEKYYPPVRNPPDVRLLMEIDPKRAPLSISLSTTLPGCELAVASIVTEVVLRCRHKYGVSTGEGVSRPWKNQNG